MDIKKELSNYDYYRRLIKIRRNLNNSINSTIKKLEYLNDFVNIEFNDPENILEKTYDNFYEAIYLNNERIKTLNLRLCFLRATIKNLNDKKLEIILTERYINKKTWEQISIDTFYSLKQLHRLHNQAIKKLKDCLKYKPSA